MNKDYVVVMRMEDSQIDILGIIISMREDIVKIEHPYQAWYDNNAGTMKLIAYCTLTDQTLFEFKRSKMQFLVPASDDVAEKFLDLINEDVPASTAKDTSIDDRTTFISGNDTKH